MTQTTPPCPLCNVSSPTPSWLHLWCNEKLHVLRVLDNADYPAFYRVVWHDHKAEWSDLSRPDRILCMDAVTLIEEQLRQALKPTKINLASLGNMVAHVHWHVIARFEWDAHFPESIWAPPQRHATPSQTQHKEAVTQRLAQLDAELIRHLNDWAKSLPSC